MKKHKLMCAKDLIQDQNLLDKIRMLRQLVSAPQEIYEEVYEHALHQMIRCCQKIPEILGNKEGCILHTQLEVLIAALKIRRGKMLPLNADSETIAAQEPAWTYALFICGLAWGLSRISENYTLNEGGVVTDQNEVHEMDEKFYVLLSKKEEVGLSLAKKFAPSIAINWLRAYPDLYATLEETLLHEEKYASDNVLIEILRKAADKSGITIDPAQYNARNNQKPVDVKTLFLEWINASLLKPEMPVGLLRMEEGVLAEKIGLRVFISECLDGSSNNEDRLVKELEEYLVRNPSHSGKTTKNDGFDDTPWFYSYRSTHFENREKKEGVVVSMRFLSDEVNKLPVQSGFIQSWVQ